MIFDKLAELGWDEAWRRSFDQFAESGTVPGRVIEQQRGLWLCATSSGDRLCRQPGHSASPPAAGDWVVIDPAAEPEPARIRATLPRRSQLIREAAGAATAAQVLAANMDTLLICMALDRDFNLRRLERILIVAWSSGAQPVVILTKPDLLPAAEREAHLAQAAAVAPGVALHCVSGLTGDGLAALAPLLAPGRTIALIGASGAGKSTLLNALAGTELTPTGALDNDGKGRHTTTWRALHRLPCGALVLDNPGIRALKLWDGAAGLTQVFTDIERLSRDCRFRDCRHEGEPGCAVAAAIASGELDPDRLASRDKLARELAFAERKQNQAAAAAEKARWKRIHKDTRARTSHRARLRGE